MNSLKKRNLYIGLMILCMLSVITIQSLFFVTISPTKEFRFDIDKEKVLNSSHQTALALFSLFLLTVFIVGIINLIIFIVKKVKKKPLTSIYKPVKKFPLSEETASKVLFLISFLMLVIYILPLTVPVLKDKQLTMTFSLLLNMVLQLGVIIVILRYIKAEFFGFSLDKKQLVFILRIYSALIVLLLVSSIVNTFIIKKIGLESLPGPAMELLLQLNNKFSLFILVVQIALTGPIAEELFFRGFIYKLFRGRYKFIISATVTSLLFSVIHKVPQGILPLFLISLSLCYIYEKTQNILPAIIFHSLHNTITLSVFFVMKTLT